MVARHRVHKRPANKGGVRKADAPSSYTVAKTKIKLEQEEKEKVEKKLAKELKGKQKMGNELEDKKVELEKEKCERKELEKVLAAKEAELEMEREKRNDLVTEAVQKRLSGICGNPMARKIA
jgi:hypothetical protein